MKRDKRVIITMTMEDWQAIKAAAGTQGLSVASFLRQAGLNNAKREPKKEEGK